MKENVNNWKIINNKLCKQFDFKEFTSAIAFINKIALEAEKANHHPDIFLYHYSHVKISLFTHSVNQISAKDYQLAEIIDHISLSF